MSALPEPPAAEFFNAPARSREERMAMNDKDALERLRLGNRRGGHYRYDPEDMYTNPIVPMKKAAAFISEAERFGTNAAAEEFEHRQRKILEKEEFFERKRMATYEKETARWGKVHQQDAYFDQRAEDLKEEPISNNNKSKVEYDPITLQYRDSYGGQMLRYEDEHVKYKSALRREFLQRHLKSSVEYNTITGEPLVDRFVMPDRPQPPPEPAPREREQIGPFRVDALYGDELETHETIDGSRNKWELESAKFDGAHVPGAHTREEYEWLGLGHPKSNYLKPPREGKNGYDGETWGALGPIDGKNLK